MTGVCSVLNTYRYLTRGATHRCGNGVANVHVYTRLYSQDEERASRRTASSGRSMTSREFARDYRTPACSLSAPRC